MSNETEKDPWELESGINPDRTDADGIDTDAIDADNIKPEIPKDLWDSFLWEAVRAAIPVSNTKEDVIRKVKLWNTHNNPQIPETELVRKVLWALRAWDSPFKRVR